MTYVDQDPIQSNNPDVDLSGSIPHITVRPQPKQGVPQPVDYDPFSESSVKKLSPQRGPLPVDYDPFSKQPTQEQPEEPIDYKSGTPFHVRTMLQRAENPNEAQKLLEHYYGPGNYGQNEKGQWWVNQDGKKTAVMPSGFLQGVENFGAGLAASASPMAGAIAGGSLGAMATPIAPPFGAAVGAGLGAATGWGLDQLVKYYQGLYDQSPQEAVRHASNEAMMNTALVGALPIVRKATSGVANSIRDWLGTTPTTKSMTERLVGEGARPPIISAAPNFRSWADKQKLRNIVTGDPGETQNVAYIQQRMKDALKSSGMNDAEISGFMADVTNPLEAPTRTPAGQSIVQSVQERVGAKAAVAQASKQEAEQHLRSLEQAIRNYANQPVGRIGQEAADAIIGQRRSFGQAMSRKYSEIDAMTGNTPTVPLDSTFAASQKLVALAEPGLVPQYIKSLAERGKAINAAKTKIAELQAEGGVAPQELQAIADSGVVPFSEAHEIRSNLRELLGSGVDLTRTPYMHKIADVAEAVGSDITSGAASHNLTADAVRELKQTDAIYRKGIAKFYDAQINKLVRDARSGLVPDAEAVASTIIRDGKTEAAHEILRMMSPELRANIARVDLRNMIQDASYRGLDGNMALDGMAFLNQLDKRGAMGPLLYTPKQLGDLKSLGNQLAALNGKIDVTNLPPSQVKNAISSYIQHTKDIDEFVKGNPMAAFMTGRPEVIDRAVRYITMPGRDATTAEAARFLGTSSPQWQSVQRNALRDLMRSAVTETPSRIPTISGEKIEKAFSKYTKGQQELLFPGGLAADLKEVAKESRFLFPPGYGAGGQGDFATSQAAKSITLHTGFNIINPRTAYADMRWIYTSIMGWVTDRPGVLRFLANASRQDPSTAKRMMGAIGRWVINEQTMGPGRGQPSQVQP